MVFLMSTLANALDALMTDLQTFQDVSLVRHTWSIHPELPNTHRELLNAIQTLARHPDIQHLTAKHYDIVLYRIYDAILGKTTRLYIPEDTVRRTRDPVDALFRKLGIDQVDTHFQSLATRTFQTFCRGITTFNMPCGDELHATWNTQATEEARDIARNRVSKCYIERLIYDELYKYYLHEQDVRHLVELHKMNRIHAVWFPGTEIRVRIRYEENFYPCECIIEQEHPASMTLTTETYTKRPWFRDDVMCSKTVSVATQMVAYSKTQSFDQETPWTVVKRRATRGGMRGPPAQRLRGI